MMHELNGFKDKATPKQIEMIVLKGYLHLCTYIYIYLSMHS